MKPLLAFVVAAVVAGVASCSSCDSANSCERGDCRAGNCLVDGQCVEVAGRPCSVNSDCPSGICLGQSKDDPNAYCSVTCGGNDDCPQGYVCAGDPGRCAKSTANDQRGCIAGSECGKCGRCVDGKCSSSASCPVIRCADAASCPTCMECKEGACVPKEGCAGTECAVDTDCGGCAKCEGGFCVNPPGCGASSCASDEDCPYGKRCATSGAMAGKCIVPGADAIGADCTAADPTPCNGGLCFADDQETYCTVDCDGDPGLCPYGFACKIVAEGIRYCRKTGGNPVLGKACTREKDCDTDKGETCVYVVSADGTAVEQHCSLPFPDGLSLGSTCAQAGDCETNLCPSDTLACAVPCVRDGDCMYGFVCEAIAFSIDDAGVVTARGCVYRDTLSGRAGDYCPDGSSDCRAGTCPAAPAGGPQPVCLVDCAGGAVCPDGLTCRDDDVFGTATRACLPDMLPQECRGDGDCTDGKVCALSRDPDAGMPVVTCVDARAGGAKPGEPCNYTSGAPYCENNQCGRDSICAQYCGEGDACREGYVCDYKAVDLADGTTKYVRACIEKFGSRTPCVTDKDCAGGEVCRAWLYPDGAETHFGCQGPRPGGAATGAACGPASADRNTYCANDLCTAEGRCTTHCAVDADCPSAQTCGMVQARLYGGAEIYFQGCKSVSSKGGLGDPCPNGYIDCDYDYFCADIGFDADGGVIRICTMYCGGDTGVDCTAPDAGSEGTSDAGPGAFECRDVSGNMLCVPLQ